MPSSHGAVPHSLCSPYSADCDHRPAPSLSAGECSNTHDSFPHPAPNQQHTHVASQVDWWQLWSSSSHIQDFTIWILSTTAEVFISLLNPWDRLYFPKMATVIAPILHDLTAWLWSRHAPHQVLGLFPHPHILNTGRHLWRPQTTERGVMMLYYFWHR